MPAAHVIFHGRVQGVFFRANTRDKSNELGVCGWVRNLPDRTVEAFFEGPREKVEVVIKWCRASQPYAKVSKVDVDWVEEEGCEGFKVKY